MNDIPTPDPSPRFSGGEIPIDHQRQYVALRNLLQKEADVHQVLELSRQSDGKWMYLIQTPYVTFPKYVIGRTDVENESVDILFRCGAEWSARSEWDKRRYGQAPGSEEAGS